MTTQTYKVIKDYISVVSVNVNKKHHGETVYVGGKIKSIMFPFDILDKDGNSTGEYTEGLMKIDDSIGEINVVIPKDVYDRDKSVIKKDNTVLIKGIVSQLVKKYCGKVLGKENRVIASSIIALSTIKNRESANEKRSKSTKRKHSSDISKQSGWTI